VGILYTAVDFMAYIYIYNSIMYIQIYILISIFMEYDIKISSPFQTTDSTIFSSWPYEYRQLSQEFGWRLCKLNLS
jgi:hypothetical protein